jgi:hypothetical protein
MTTVRQKIKERAAGRKFFRGLTRAAKDELGNALVLGYFDWTDWLDTKPTAAFLSEVDRERMYWESEA